MAIASGTLSPLIWSNAKKPSGGSDVFDPTRIPAASPWPTAAWETVAVVPPVVLGVGQSKVIWATPGGTGVEIAREGAYFPGGVESEPNGLAVQNTPSAWFESPAINPPELHGASEGVGIFYFISPRVVPGPVPPTSPVYDSHVNDALTTPWAGADDYKSNWTSVGVAFTASQDLWVYGARFRQSYGGAVVHSLSLGAGDLPGRSRVAFKDFPGAQTYVAAGVWRQILFDTPVLVAAGERRGIWWNGMDFNPMPDATYFAGTTHDTSPGGLYTVTGASGASQVADDDTVCPTFSQTDQSNSVFPIVAAAT